MAPPAMLLLLAVDEVQVVGFLKAEVVFEVDPEMVVEVLQVEVEVVLAELEVGSEALQVGGEVLLLPTEHSFPVDISVAALLLVLMEAPVLLVVEWLLVVSVVLMLAELGLSSMYTLCSFPILALAL